MEKFKKYAFQVFEDENKLGWYYRIFTPDLSTVVYRSSEYFQSEGIARYAAIGHVTLLEGDVTLPTERF